MTREMTEQDVEQAMTRLLEIPMTGWDAASQDYRPEDRAEMSRRLDGEIERRAVKAQNRLAARIRRVLGFSCPQQDITF
jgi:hypothetical protein